MTSLAAVPGIAIPPDEIRAALQSVAIPGYTGSLQLEIGLSEEAAKHIMIAVIRRETKKPGDGATRQLLPDPERRKPVEKVVADIREKLRIRPVLIALEAHYLDGVLQKYTVLE